MLVRRTTGILLITSNFQLDCEIHSDRSQRAGRNQKSDAMKFHVDYRSLNCRNLLKFSAKLFSQFDSTKWKFAAQNSKLCTFELGLVSSAVNQENRKTKKLILVPADAWPSDDSTFAKKHNLHSIERRMSLSSRRANLIIESVSEIRSQTFPFAIEFIHLCNAQDEASAGWSTDNNRAVGTLLSSESAKSLHHHKFYLRPGRPQNERTNSIDQKNRKRLHEKKCCRNRGQNLRNSLVYRNVNCLRTWWALISYDSSYIVLLIELECIRGFCNRSPVATHNFSRTH